ncbi:hypothetical protein C2845_PM12G08820 [Panicum miliaceum]|uniref:BAG domain-containing protein n=1 Tax=Panicum miliaceum TaxID=4540 RepID=A0A3L6QD84_PANMI|nr:hypothetical protein C2845_PM12G08820 [Panicum miliaceum]
MPYGCDKLKSHSCGCPNHVCHGAEKSNVKIEEERPDVKLENEHKDAVWVPAGYDEPKEKVKELKRGEAPNNSEEAPRSPKIKVIPLSWFENGHHDQKPSTRDGSGDHGDRSAVKNQPAITEHRDGMTLEGSPKTTPVVPKRVNDERKPSRENYKTIPVVPENEIDEKKATTYRTIPVMRETDEKQTGMSEKKEAKKASNAGKVEENGKTKHSESSTAKHSKLPPVCLRVDPFPRKKSGNGSSRSPSPPTRKDGDKAKKDMKQAQGQNLEPKQSDTRHITVSEVKEKSPNETKKGMASNNETVQAPSMEHSWEEEVPTSKDDQKVQAGSSTIGTPENSGARSLQGGVVQENAGADSLKGYDKSKNEDETVIETETAKDDARTCRANLSEPDAAVRIQSAYRGYDVRRWQPLDKLRKIRNVHEQMQGVKKQLQCLEDSCKKPTDKEQVAISENIMDLLLKLDTIQGLHPSVREARKSAARELVCLQEKLDCLCKQPSWELNLTNSDEEKSERAGNIVPTVAPTVTTEACDKQSQEERAVELGKLEEPSSVDSMEPCDEVPSGIPMEVEQDADAGEQKNEKEESCSTTMEEANEKGRAAEQFELQVPSSMDMLSDAGLPEYPTDNQEHEVEESNAVSVEQVTEEKPAVEDEEKEAPLLVNSTEQLHDSASAEDSSRLKQCTASTEQSLHAESNTGLSSASTEDINATAVAASLESGVATEKDGSVDGQVHGTAAIESMELKRDASLAEEDQQRELSGPIVHLEDSSVSLQDEGQYDPSPADDSVVSNTKDRSEEATDISIQEQAVDTMQDSTEEPDEIPEASMNNVELSASADAEKPDQPALLEPILKPDSDPEQTVVDESDDAVQCGVSRKDEPPHEDQKTEATVDKLTGGSTNDGYSLLGASRKEPDIQESHPNLAEEADDTRDENEIVFPELDSYELSCAHEGAITAGANAAEEEAHNLKQDIAVQMESKACEEALSAAGTPDDGLKDSGEKKLAEENQQLKELLQKLLASGNDQMGVITDLSEKVKVLERKLARKKRPKVRVHRPSGHATAKVH